MRLLLLFFTFSLSVYCQKEIDPDKIIAFNITVNTDNSTIKTQMLKNNKSIKVDNTADYLWYSSNKIMETKGGYDGKLIHGYYKSFYLNNQLKEQGKVKYGLKNKEWKYWYDNGLLKESITWKNGKKNGPYKIFNEYGQLMASSSFKNDLLHGRFYTYDKTGKVLERKKFKNGNEIIKAPKKVKDSGEKKEKWTDKLFRKKGKKVSKEKHNKREGKKSSNEKKNFRQKLKSIFKFKNKKESTTSAAKKETVS